MARHKKQCEERLDYHEGLSPNQVKIICRELKLDNDKFSEWMFGQTCPIIQRYNDDGKLISVTGVYEYDLFRWISSQKTGVAPIWD